MNERGILTLPDPIGSAYDAALNVPKNATDTQLRVRAKTISEGFALATTIANLGEEYLKDAKTPEEQKDARARAHADAINMLATGRHDYEGRAWTPDHKGFKTGQEYFSHMRGLVLGSNPLTEDYRKYLAADEAERDRLAAEDEALWDKTIRAGGDIASFAYNLGETPRLSDTDERNAPKEVRDANALLYVRDVGGTAQDPEVLKAAEETVAKYHDAQRRAGIRAKYEAKLMRKNAGVMLTSMLPMLSEDGQRCAKAILDSDDDKLPDSLYDTFRNLDDKEKSILGRVRSMMKEGVEGGFWNTVGDMGIGFANVASSVMAAPYRFGNKFGTMLFLDDYGFDINKIARDRQALYEVTGDVFAGGDWTSGALPQLKFENFCEEHGFVGNALIGAVSTLPYMAAASVPYAGTAMVALEAMGQFDDHVAMNGGDITDPRYIFSSAIMGGVYAYIEKLQLEKLLGGVSNLRLQEATLKGFFAGAEARRAVTRTLFAGTLSESLQEGLQNGIMSVNEALALDKDVVRAFGEGFIEDFVGSLGTMFVIESGGLVVGHARRSGWRGGAAGQANRSANLTKLYNAMQANAAMLDLSERGWDMRQASAQRRFATLYGVWKDGGVSALVEKGNLSQEDAASLDTLYTSLRTAEGARAPGSTAADEFKGRGGDMSAIDGLYERFVNGDIEADMFVEALKINGFSEQGAADFVAMLNAEQDLQQKYAAWFARSGLGFIESSMSDKEVAEAVKAGNERNFAKVADAMRNLEWVRNIWAKGAGAEYKGEDPGAAALMKAGFSEKDARSLSKLFLAERRNAYSPKALDGIRALYESATRGRVGAMAALGQEFGGRLVHNERGDFLSFSRDGKPAALVQIIEGEMPAIDHRNVSDSVATSVQEATKNKAKPITKEMWQSATDAQREAWVKEYGLVDEGGFTPLKFVNPDDASVKIDGREAGELMGVIRLDPRRDPSAVFHEIFHAWSRFMIESGIWTEEDVKRLQERFGKPETSGECFNEEVGANEFRGYILRRMSGAMSEADEKDGIFRKLWRLVRRVKAASDEREAQTKIAKTAGEAFFDQIIADLYKGVPDFSKDEKPAPEPKSESAPQMPGKSEAGTESAESETKKPESGTETGETETKKPETGTPAPTRAGAAATGWSAATPTGNVRVSGHWAVFDLSELIHSNNPLYAKYMRNQLRNRKSNKAEEDARENIINNFDPARLFEAPDTANGAPIVFIDVDDEGKMHPYVLSGNGRVLVLNALADRHMYDKYREFMKQWAAENGLDVGDGENKVVVRVIDEYGGATREQVADLSNTNSIQQYTEEEQARADAETIKNLGLAKLYRANADGSPDMTPGANDEFFMRFIQATGDTSLYNADRTITETARARVQRALLAIAVGQGDRGREVVKKLVDRADTLGVVRQKNALAVMAADVAALESNADYSIGPDVSRAVADFLDFIENKDAGKKWGTVENFLAQQDLLDGPSEIAKELVSILASRQSAADMAEYVRQYCDAASKEDPTGGLFGAESARTRTDIWRDAKKLVDERRAQSKAVQEERHSISSRIPESKDGAIRLVQIGDFYYAFGKDAERAAPLMGSSLVTRNGEAQTGTPARMLNMMLAKIIRNGESVALMTYNPDGTITKYRDITPGDTRHSIAAQPHPATSEEMDRAVAHFGTTSNFNEAGYILPDGRMLDLSGRNEGAPGGRRTLDHRAVWDVMEDRANGGDAMSDFVAGGAIRLQPEAFGAMFGAKPTEAQEAVLIRYFARFDGEMNVDIMAPNGDFVSSASYSEGTRPQRILNEVKRYYDEGTELTGTGEQADGSYRYSIYSGEYDLWDAAAEAKDAREAEVPDNGDYYGFGRDKDSFIVKQFLALKRELPPHTFLFFRIGDFLQTFGLAETRLVSSVLETPTSHILDQTAITGIPYTERAKAILKLRDIGWNVAIAEQMENRSSREGGARREITWYEGSVGKFDRGTIRFSIASRLDEERKELEAKGGKLLLAYHGTSSPGFTVFSRSDDQGFFFAKSRNTAASYIRTNMPSDADINALHPLQTPGERHGGIYDVALRMENPLIIDAHGANWNQIVSDENDLNTYYRVIKVGHNSDGRYYVKTSTIDNQTDWQDFDTPEKMVEWVRNEIGGDLGANVEVSLEDYKDRHTWEDTIVDERSGQYWLSSNDAYPGEPREGQFLDYESTRDVVSWAFDNEDDNYDGVIFRNLVDNGGGNTRFPVGADEIYVVKNSNQVKAVDEMTYADDGSIVPAEARLDWTNPDIRFSFAIGEQGATNLEDALFIAGNLRTAREMLNGRDWEKIKKDDKLKIKLATGWEKGADGKWRHEVADFPEIEFNRLKKPAKSGEPSAAPQEAAPTYAPVKLSKLFVKRLWQDIPLFKAYPWLKDVTVQYGANLGRGVAGSLGGSKDGAFKIEISEELRPDAAGVRKTLIHELQHAIQSIEKFAQGGSASLMERLSIKNFETAREEAHKWMSDFRAILHRYDTWTGLKYTNYPLKHPCHIEAAAQIESDPAWPALEESRIAFRKKWGHNPKYFIDSDWGAIRKAMNSSFRDYRNLAGEVEARVAPLRTPADATTLWSDTEDVARKSQILLGEGAVLMQRVVEAEQSRARYSFASLRANALAGIRSVRDAETMERQGKEREDIFRETGWWRSADGQWRVELPFHGRFAYDGNLNGRHGESLDAFWEWPELFALYPELSATIVKFVPDDDMGGAAAAWERYDATIYVAESHRLAPDLPAIFIHEIQHAIQNFENLAIGGDPAEFIIEGRDDEAYRQYDHLAGEVEARNAAERFFMSPEERLERPPWMTQDWSDESQIVRFDEPQRYSLAALNGAPRLDTYMDVADFAHEHIFNGSADDSKPENRFEHWYKPDLDRYCALDYQTSLWVICLNRQMKPIANPIPVHKGGLNFLLTHPREIFRTPINWGVKDVAIIRTDPIRGSGHYTKVQEKIDHDRMVESAKILGLRVRSWTIVRSDGMARPYGTPDFDFPAPFRDPPIDEIRREIARQMSAVRYSFTTDEDIENMVAHMESTKEEWRRQFESLPLSERYPLVAAHGMSQSALKKALKSGTLLMPSVGVAQAGNGWTHAGYTDWQSPGKAFVMFPKEVLTGEKSDMFLGDAFTPTINDLLESGVVTPEGEIPDAPALDEKIEALRDAFNKDLRGLERVTNLDEESLRKALYEMPDWDDADIADAIGENPYVEAKLWRRVKLEEAKAVVLVGLDPDLAKSLREKGLKVIELPEGAKPYEIARAEGETRFSFEAQRWDPDFPQVATITNPHTLTSKYPELYKAAKEGSIKSAVDLVEKLVGPPTIGTKGVPSPKYTKIKQISEAHPNARVVPVFAVEASGHNMLPYAYAWRFHEIGGLPVDTRIRQTVKANHTGKKGVERMFSRAEFAGPVKRGAEYILIDDVVTQGGTLNELRKYIQSRGGKVVAASTLTAAKFSATIRISETKVQQLFLKFGDIDELLRAAGIANGTEELTESEARELLKYSSDALRAKLAEQVRNGRDRVADEEQGSENKRLLQRLNREKAETQDELPGLGAYYDSNLKLYPTRFAKAKEFNHPISQELNSLIDELLQSDALLAKIFTSMPEAEAEKELAKRLKDYIDLALRSEEIGPCHKRMMESYPATPYEPTKDEHDKVVAELSAPVVTASINDALKAKNADLIKAINEQRPDLAPLAVDGTGSYKPAIGRICHIIIGPPAAGKSEVFANKLSLQHRARIIDSDTAKSRLKHFDGGFGANYVHEASSKIFTDVFNECLRRGENIVVPIVGAKEKSVTSRIDQCHRNGYTVYLHLNQLPILKAYARCLIRTLNTGRYINPQVLLDCGEKPTHVYQQITKRKESGEGDQSGLPDHYDEFSNDVILGAPPVKQGGDYIEPAYPNATISPSREEVESKQSIGGQYILPGFEQLSRRSIVSELQDGGADAKERALVNFVAYFQLAHGPKTSAKTVARLGLSIGMPTVNIQKIFKSADALAERMRGTIVQKAAENGDVATASALMNREQQIDSAVENLISGGVEAGAKLTHSGVGQINSLLNRRVEQMMRDFTAATLADMEGETGLDIAAEILANDPTAFAGEIKKAKGIDPNAPAPADGSSPDGQPSPGLDRPLTDYERFQRDQARKAAIEKVEKFIAQAKARAVERKRLADERRRRAEEAAASGDGGVGDGTNLDSRAALGMPSDNAPHNMVANFKTKEEFAAFMRVWAADRFKREHGHSTLAQAEQDKLFAEFYRITVRKELSDLADKLLAPRGARAHVNRRLQDMEKGTRPDTIERISASLFAFINAAAIRESRVELVQAFKKEVKEKYAKGKLYEDLKLDSDRRVTGWVEEAARYICHVCDLSTREINGNPSQIEEERRKLQEIIDRREKVYEDSGKEIASAVKEDMETKRAYAKMALLEKYGAMTSLMPGQILDLQEEAHEYLESKAAELAELWRETRAYEDELKRNLGAAIRGPNGGQRYEEKGWLNGRLFDALNGLLRLRLKHLTRFAPDKARANAEKSINNIIVMLGDGETAYARALQDDRQAFFTGLAEIFRTSDGRADNAAIRKYLERMDEKIPPELARQISLQGLGDTMTYGQMLQLLVSLEQQSYADAIRDNGREGQAELIRRNISSEDVRFIEWLRAFYAAKREVLSPIMLRMVGQEVASPDPLYAPVRMSMEDRVRGLHTDTAPRWDPISAVMTRRVQTSRDFDESASIVGMFFSRSNETAKLIAWAERGSVIRAVFTSVGVQSAIRRAFGAGELSKILTQLEATFNGGKARSRTPGELAAVDKALNFTTYAYLGFNPLSAAKQTTSFTVWANALPGGFRDLWRYMTHFDKAAWDHIRQSEQYKVRYGDDIGSGQDLATRGLYQNPSQNPVARFFSGAGMKLLKIGDFAPGGWIAQGLYKDLLNRHMSEGMEFDEADRLAMTETFNLIEETQQSGRTYNTNMLTIEHGRIGRLLTQFATSPLQQLQYETQAWREWRDMVRYDMGEDRIAQARQRFVRAAVINHILLPAALNLVTAMFKAAMGDEPPWEKDGWHWTLLIEVLLGQFSRIFFLGAFAQTTLEALFMRKSQPRQLLPVEGALGIGASAMITLHDLATMDVENLQKDLERAIRSTAPTRIPYNLYRRFTGDSDRDRKRRKEARRSR